MSFTFKPTGTPQTNNSDTERKEVDWAGLNQYVIDVVGTANEAEQVVGVCSGAISLGLQPQDPARMLWTGDAESEAAELAKNNTQWFEDAVDEKTGAKIRVKRWEQKPQETVVLTWDFPQYMLNKGTYFGDENAEAHPLRMLQNGEFYIKGIGRVVGKQYSLKESRNPDGSWSLKNNSILYKVGAATDSLDDKGNFKSSYLGNVIGKAALFEIRVFNKESDGKKYFTESIKLSGKVPKAMQSMVPVLDDKYKYVVMFDGEQNEEVLKNLRQSVINTMQQAVNFKGSSLEAALLKIGKIKASDSSQEHQSEQAISKPTAQQETRKVEPSPTPQGSDTSFEEDLPFSPIGLQEGRMFLHMI